MIKEKEYKTTTDKSTIEILRERKTERETQEDSQRALLTPIQRARF